MNRENTARLVEFLEGLDDDSFDMGTFFRTSFMQEIGTYAPLLPIERFVEPVERHACGAVGCIAGWSVALFGHVTGEEWNGAVEHLGIETERDARFLFYGMWSEGRRSVTPNTEWRAMSEISRREVIDYLKSRIEAGSWESADEWVNAKGREPDPLDALVIEGAGGGDRLASVVATGGAPSTTGQGGT